MALLIGPIIAGETPMNLEEPLIDVPHMVPTRAFDAAALLDMKREVEYCPIAEKPCKARL